MQEPGVGIPAELVAKVRQQGIPLGLAPAGPEPRQGRALDRLEIPGLLPIEAQVADDRVQRRRIQVPGKESVADVVEVAVRGQGCPDLREEAGAIHVAPHEVPGTALAAAQFGEPGVAVGSEEARHVHEGIVRASNRRWVGMTGSVPQGPDDPVPVFKIGAGATKSIFLARSDHL